MDELLTTLTIGLCPFNGLQIYNPETYETLSLAQLEDGSVYNIEPMTRPHFRGGEVTIGYRFDATAVIPHDDYVNNQLIDRFESETWKNKRFLLLLLLGNQPFFGLSGTPPEFSHSNISQYMQISYATIKYKIESGQLRPRMLLTMTGTLTTLGSGMTRIFQNE
jgi:hypothetical protein